VEEPELRDVTGRGHLVACHLVGPGGEAPVLVREGSTTAEVASRPEAG
jgi:hypothetical protein